jgi:hypothetical protein
MIFVIYHIEMADDVGIMGMSCRNYYSIQKIPFSTKLGIVR